MLEIKITNQKQGSTNSRIYFSSNVKIEEIYDCYHKQIIDEGWQLLSLEQEDDNDDKLSAYYYQQGKLFGLNLDKLNEKRYRLKLSLD